MQPTERFSDRAAVYTRGRPTYPDAIVAHLRSEGALPADSVVVDLGVGTGLSAEPFLRAGYSVIGVEPNDAMRAVGDERLAHCGRYLSVSGRAEATTLDAHCARLVIAGQAFHWFDPPRAGAEARRIAMPGGWAALIWNDRPATGTPFLEGYEALLHAFGVDYAQVAHRHVDEDAIRRFFAPTMPRIAHFENPRSLGREELEALVGSASYMPAPGHPRHAEMSAALRRLFDAHAVNGRVQMHYRTRMHYGPITD
ncbi:MAG: class I SAM-dependent methyltransferase [Burkholderiaceae bacterium]|jgi:SAM-dependent methyltransferase|nr:class I SAM-dependent methyltransferase [Burkholderiaceae bacterium]